VIDTVAPDTTRMNPRERRLYCVESVPPG